MAERTLISGGQVVTVDPSIGTLDRGDVLIDGREIVQVGTDLDAGDAEIVDASRFLVMPGFVDTHRHNWQAVFRGIGSDWPLSQYRAGMHGLLKQYYQPQDTYVGNFLGRLEALSSGITTMLDWCHGILSPEHADGAIQGLTEARGRSVFGYGGRGGVGSRGVGFPNDDAIEADLRRVRDRYFSSDDQLVTLALALRGPQYSSMPTVERDVRLARELDLRVSVHGGSATIGRNRPVAQMHDLGLLDARTTVIHGNTLADDELQMMADAGCSASVSPDVEVQMGFGWPATGRFLDVGIRPSLSIDDCASMAGDMFGTMRTTIVTQRGLDNLAVDAAENQERLRLQCSDVVEFATIEGARACGLDHKVGSITPGKEADLLLLRSDDLTVFPVNHPAGTIVYSAHPGLVDTVFVAGEVVKRDGAMVGYDLPRLRRMALESRDGLIERAKDDDNAHGIRLGGGWAPRSRKFMAGGPSTGR